MKKNFLSLSLLGLIILSASCVKELEQTQIVNTGKTIQVEFSLPEQATKGFNDEQALVWEVGDQVKFISDNGQNWTSDPLAASQISNDGHTASFTFPAELIDKDRTGWFQSTKNQSGIDGKVEFSLGQSFYGSTYAQTVAGVMNSRYCFLHSGIGYTSITHGVSPKVQMQIPGSIFRCIPYTTLYNDESIVSVQLKSDSTPIVGTVQYNHSEQSYKGLNDAPDIKCNEIIVNLTTPFSLNGVTSDAQSKGVYMAVARTAIPVSDYSYIVKTNKATYTFSTNGLNVSDNKVKNVFLNLDKATSRKINTMYINNADEFIAFMGSEFAANADANTTAYIAADLDFTGKTISTPCAKFNGVLEGQNHKITNLVNKQPLFTELYSAKNLTFDNTCSFENATSTFMAPLAGKSTGLIQNIRNMANVSYSGGSFTESVVVSGIVAWANGRVENCSNEGNISASSTGSIKGVAVGGVVGYLSAPMLSCTNSGEVQISASHLAGSRSNIGSLSARAGIGGIVGHGGKEADTEMFSMTSCTNSGKVIFKTTNLEKMTATGQRSSIGGICGGGAGPMKDCTNNAEIQVNHNTSDGSAFSAQEAIVIIGGICGGDYCISGQNSSSYDNCVNNGVLNINHDASKSNSAIGGIVGWAGAESATMTVAVKNSRNTAAINVSGKGKHRVGGISGGICNINNVENTGNITVTESNSPAVGGICGFHSQGLDIIEAKVNCTITVPANANCVGGLIGNNGNAANESGEGCEVNVTITGGNDTNAGLIIGMWNGTSKKIVLGTAEKPIKVSGSLNGVTATAENYTTLLAGSNNASDENHVLNTVFAQ